ncbi:peptidoglycan-binding LysM domain protein [Cordyceps fumosorosea ARSEF 2679]|uniref:Peptidoglycan-binding LysM domain protein n=1 Tax=Cordyceps fumosorosea (strain ARSEF 2679) TaxID=1081104 RepID=A0A168ARI7_CORFA|nr:peptidoglycan-binding LysM domain protein [Cordyceps fumosorosea ARSEF 2679]OAA69097.1 peptidoglycan-binding LysM domain protein [Cordyceps fumosorosea ARSEF 2679]
MPRQSRYDDDEERLPEGMTRVGYDADTGVYTFQDADGSYWESAPGSRYGRLTRVGHELAAEDDDAQPFLPGNASAGRLVSWRHELMPLLNFGVIIGVALLLLWWYLHVAARSDEGSALVCPTGAEPYTIRHGDTCWDIAEAHGGSVDDVLALNPKLDCDKLPVGSQICLEE